MLFRKVDNRYRSADTTHVSSPYPGTHAVLLRDLKIENYRSFENYKLEGLARVNLLVGDNNCGKTSVLEAAYILSRRGDQMAIASVLDDRGDTALVEDRIRNRQPTLVARLPNLFGSRVSENPLERRFDLGSVDFGQLALLMTTNAGWKTSTEKPISGSALSAIAALSAGDPKDRVMLSHFLGQGETVSAKLLTRDGFLELDRFQSLAVDGRSLTKQSEEGACCFISTKSLAPELLKAYWASLLNNTQESLAIEAVRIVLPELTSIVFLPESHSAPDNRADVLLDINKQRRSLASFGEGVSRLLSLGAALGVTQFGRLFIDEIDTGLHYSKLSDMWRMVIKAAKKLELQIFATSHSLDCIRALEEACDNDESLRDEVALFSIDRRMDEAVRYGGDELSVVVAHEIEVR